MPIVAKALPDGWYFNKPLNGPYVRGDARYMVLVSYDGLTVAVFKSLNYGDTWTEMDADNHMVTTVAGGQSAGRVEGEDYIHVLQNTGDYPTPAATGQTFDMSTDTWAAGTWGGAVTFDDTGPVGGGGAGNAGYPLAVTAKWLRGLGAFVGTYYDGNLDHGWDWSTDPPTLWPGNNLLGRINYCVCSPGGVWSTGPVQNMEPDDQSIGYRTASAVNGVGAYTAYFSINATNENYSMVTPSQAYIEPFPPASNATISNPGEARVRRVVSGSLVDEIGTYAPHLTWFTNAGGQAGANFVIVQSGDPYNSLFVQVVPDGDEVPVPSGDPTFTDTQVLGSCQLDWGEDSSFVLFLFDELTSSLLYQIHDGAAWSEPAALTALIPDLSEALNGAMTTDYGIIGASSYYYYDLGSGAASGCEYYGY